MISGSKVIHIENGNKIKLGKVVEVSEQTFENHRKNVIKQKNQEVQIDYLCCKCKILPKFGNEIVKKYSFCSNLNFAKLLNGSLLYKWGLL